MAQRILALDPARLCGFAHTNGRSGVWHLDDLGHGLGAEHYRLAQLLEESIAAWGCELIAAENAGFGSVNRNTQSQHDERLGVIRLTAQRHGLKLVLFHPTTIKSFATGYGHAKKPEMVAAARRHFNVRVSDDEADALFILALAQRPDCWAPEKPKRERRRNFRSVKAARQAGKLF